MADQASSVPDRQVSRACSARKVALDRGASEFEAMRFVLETLSSGAVSMIEEWTNRRWQP